eukprot:536356_1
MFIWLNRIRGKWAASSAYSYGDNACIESTDAKEYTSYSYLKPIVALFLIQLVCTVIFPTSDIFLDLRGFSPFIYKRIISLYPDSKHKNRICCPGAGFSGFWFSLGRLHAIEADAQIKIKKNRTITMQYFDDLHGPDDDDDDDDDNSISNPADYQPLNYECFSAGCLSVVAAFIQIPMENVMDLAINARDSWKSGNIGRFDVVESFVDGLLEYSKTDSTNIPFTLDDHSPFEERGVLLTDEMLSRIHVITSTIQESGNFIYVSRSPKSIAELREMLIQTTWIPYITGNSLWRKDNSNGEHHMDGAFTGFNHMRCSRKLALPLNADLLLNALSLNLMRSKAEKFYDFGYNYKLP